MSSVKRVVKRITNGLGATVLLLALVLFVGIRWGWTPLPKPPAGVRRQPLRPPLTLNDLKPNNAAFYYLSAVRQLANYRPSDEYEKEREALLERGSYDDTSAITQALAECREALGLLRQGLDASTCQIPWNNLTTNEVTTTSALRFLSRLLCCSGKLAEQDGDNRRAISEYLSSIEFANDCSQGSHVLGRLVANAIRSRGCYAIRQCVLQRVITNQDLLLATEELRRLQPDIQPLSETLRYELLAAKGMFDTEVLTNAGAAVFIDRHACHQLADAAFGSLISEADKPPWQSQLERAAASWDDSRVSTWRLLFNRPVPSIYLSLMIPPFKNIGVRSARADVEMNATILVCALKHYAAANGTPPEHLNELVPEFIPSIPDDPFDGKPLRYRCEGDEWLIWSVGADREDGNAAWHEFKYHRKGDTRTGGDIYFKSTEPQDDIAWRQQQEKTHTRN